MSNWFTNIFKTLFGWFSSPKGKQVLGTIQSLAPTALEVVTLINAGTPNRTIAEINLIASKYGLPTVKALGSVESGTDVGNVLLNLATGIIKQYAPEGTAKNVIQTVAQLAYSELDSKR